VETRGLVADIVNDPSIDARNTSRDNSDATLHSVLHTRFLPGSIFRTKGLCVGATVGTRGLHITGHREPNTERGVAGRKYVHLWVQLCNPCLRVCDGSSLVQTKSISCRLQLMYALLAGQALCKCDGSYTVMLAVNLPFNRHQYVWRKGLVLQTM
jgi:hypothetical protein